MSDIQFLDARACLYRSSYTPSYIGAVLKMGVEQKRSSARSRFSAVNAANKAIAK